MFDWFRRKKRYTAEERERLEEAWYTEKSATMEKILGAESDRLLHAVIPYQVGGGLDLYFYPNGIDGTAIATKELALACKKSPKNSRYEKYEFVMFTSAKIDPDSTLDAESYAATMQKRINAILNMMARYSAVAKLNPGDTCEVPKEVETIGGACLILDSYESEGVEWSDTHFGLMLIMEVQRDEMEFAMKNGSARLFSTLKNQGVYPYSDMNRLSVLDAIASIL